jgi:two-component system chemotaxis response regulator CheB
MKDTRTAPPSRVLIVDDSAVVREALTKIIDADPRLSVMGSAADPFRAAERLKRELPDVITLDVEMPRMDGITFLRRLMAQRPIPVVMCSSLVEGGSETLFEALEAGATDVILKPRLDVKTALEDARVTICDTIRAAALAGAAQSRPPRRRVPDKKLTADAVIAPAAPRKAMAKTTEKIIAVGASTGGTEALRVFLEDLPRDAPPVVIVQHMPEGFTTAFARRLNSLCAVDVAEARDGDRLLRGRALIAPGNRHTLVVRSGHQYGVAVKDGPLVSRHRPSVDVLFRSVAQVAGANAVGVIMTGMGDDGAAGLREMFDAGAKTFGQDEASSVIYGMPKAAFEAGAVTKQAPLELLSGLALAAASS